MHSIALFVFLLLLPLFLLFISKKKNPLPLPPSPSKLPLIGNLHQLGPLLYRSLQKLSAKHGPLMLLQLGRVPTLIISSPEMAEQILKTHDLVFASRPEVKASRFIFYGIKDMAFAPYGEYWRQMRKACAIHLFSSRMVQSFRHLRQEKVVLMLEKIARAASQEKRSVPLTDILNEFASELVCRAVLGRTMESSKMRGALCEMIHENSFLFGSFFAEDFFPGLRWVDVLLGLEGRLDRNLKRWDALFEEVFEDHRRANGSKTGEKEEDPDFAQVLLSLQQNWIADFPFENDHIKAILLDMITAGTETTAGVLDWSMAELLRNSEVMKNVQTELRENSITATGLPIQEEDLSKVNYLRATIKETLRLHPPAPLLLPRESMQDCKINGYTIPKQTRVIVNAWAIGRDSQAWEAAEKFKPERWFDSTVEYKGQDFHFIPFGAGRRICPGMNFAMAAVEIAMLNLLYFFDWKLPDGIDAHDLNMQEAPGLSAPRKEKLELVAIPRHTLC